MKTLFILGAGASKSAGAPLMNDFLDKAQELYRERAPGIDLIAFQIVFDALSDLQSVRQKSSLDLENIEAVFSTTEVGRLLGKLPGRGPIEIADLRNSLVAVIVQTIERTMRFPVSNGQIKPPGYYSQFAALVERLRMPEKARLVRDVSILTFNYDLGIDYALHFQGIPFTYGLLEEKKPKDKVPLLKLHGSINWGLCKGCREIVPFQVGEAHFNLFNETKYVFFDLGSMLKDKKHCQYSLEPPVLVPPTWDKSGYQEQVAMVWRRAASELSDAENIFVIGYSLAATDSFFRYLFAIGAQSKTLIKRVWVFNPDEDGSVKTRFEAFIGPSSKPRFRFFSGSAGLFESAIPAIQEELSRGL